MELNNDKEIRKESDIMPEKPDYAKELEVIIKSNASDERTVRRLP